MSDKMTETTASARFARLYDICVRLRWTDYGVPGRESPESRRSLEDLCEYLFMDGIDKHSRPSPPSEEEHPNAS